MGPMWILDPPCAGAALLADSPRAMLNLIFRHRARMSAIYGRVEPVGLAGERFEKAPAIRRPAPTSPGQVGRKGALTLAVPMPKRIRRKAS